MLKNFDHKGQMPNITMLYTSRNQEIPFKDLLDDLSQKYPQFKVSYLVDPQRLDPQTIGQITDLKSRKLYLSGPEPLVESLEREIGQMGVEDFKTDYFPGYPAL
jgi:ferredoxin-NADP reductase